uniref:Uncharacterized protein n=1 Tax=Panagrolaimus davidi TaxID=227884 RepID=A0A914PWF2_9BILA
MNSFHPQSISSSNQKRKSHDPMMVTCERTKFMATYHRQNFSMPDSVIFYIAKNPKTAELYLKMVKTCKYFFIKNEIIVVNRLDDILGKWRVNEKPHDFTKYNCKYWITDEIYASSSRLGFSPIIQKFYQCDVKDLFIYSQIISFNDLSLIISSAEKICLNNVTVKKCDSDIPLEDIIAIAVKAKVISDTKPTIAPKTMKELTKLANFTKLDSCTLHDLSAVFDIDTFYSYMKKNLHTKLYLTFDPQISNAFKNRLEIIVDEILETKQFNYKPPFINFYGLDWQKCRKLYQIYKSLMFVVV